jgi:hypothetical protein
MQVSLQLTKYSSARERAQTLQRATLKKKKKKKKIATTKKKKKSPKTHDRCADADLFVLLQVAFRVAQTMDFSL